MWLDRLNIFKKESGKTIKQVSEESGIPVGTLNKLFSGQTQNPKLDTVREVVHTLGHTLDDLFDPLPGQQKDLTEGEEKLIELYRTLNDEGKERLIETADDMVQSKKYKEDSAVRVDTKEA